MTMVVVLGAHRTIPEPEWLHRRMEENIDSVYVCECIQAMHSYSAELAIQIDI
jgi:hypothetical protein